MRYWQKTLCVALLMLMSDVHAICVGNWVVGASGIYAQRRGSLDVSMRYAFLPVFPIVEADNLYTNKGFGWGVFAGYQLKSDGWIWGLEGGIDWHKISSKRSVSFTDMAFTNVNGLFSWKADSLYDRDPILSLSGRMGYEIAPYFIPFMRLGAVISEDFLKVTMNGSDPNLIPVTLTASDSRWNWHYLVGVGVETPIWCTPMTARIEYNYQSRGKSLFVNGAQGISLGGEIINSAFTFSSEMHNRTQIGKLSLVWNF